MNINDAVSGSGESRGGSLIKAYNATQAKKAGGGRLDAADITTILAYHAERSAARNAELYGTTASTFAKAAPAAKVTGEKTTAPAPAKAKAAPAISQADVSRAEQAGRDAERQRVAQVFASEHAQGRERACAAALTSANNYTAAQIVAALPGMPFDAAVVADIKRDRIQACGSVWDQAIASNHPARN